MGVLDHVTATRYVTPLREGGSLPGLMEADNLGTYVVKYRGAGQGAKALIAEVISAALARTLDLPVPELVTVDVDPALASGEPDQEVQDLLRASAGLNLGVDFLPGALDYDPRAFPVDPATAGRVIWFDALVNNADRSHRNPNLLQWRGLWLIDHGATLPFHHRWSSAASYDARPYDVSDHVLALSNPDIAAADDDFASVLGTAAIEAAVAEVPSSWLELDTDFSELADARSAYVARIEARLAARSTWVPALQESARQAGARL